MYLLFLTLHNITRWLVLIFGLLVVVRAFSGWSGKKGWTQLDDRIGVFFASSLDLQLLLGLILYVVSPIIQGALRNFGGAMGNAVTRFFAVEHVAVMLLAVIAVHVGRSAVKKVSLASQKHRRAAIWFSVTLLIILFSIPWPFLSFGRPLLRLFGLTL